MSGARPRVSVVLAVHNGAKYLEQAVRSVYGQTYDDFELIVVDDGSDDATPDVLQSLKDHRMRIYRNAVNLGIARSRNTGIGLARGAYIATMDADDVSLPERLEKQVRFLDAHPRYAVVGSNFRVIDECDRVVGEERLPSRDGDIRTALSTANSFGHGTTLIRAASLREAGCYDERFVYALDYDLFLRLSERFKVANLDEFLYLYRTHPGSISVSRKREQDRYSVLARRNAFLRRSPYGNHPLVSVVLPTYNRPALLRQALRSVLDQTYPSFEVIVVDDGGEGAVAVVEELNDGTVVYIRHERNRGLAAARNTALAAARGEYIAYLDDDDVYYPNHLETALAALRSFRKAVCVTRAYRAIQKPAEDGSFVTFCRYSPYRDYFDRDLFLVTSYIPINALVHRRECLAACGVYDETLEVCEDWDFLVRLSRRYDFLFTREYTCEVRWRLDDSNMSIGRIARYNAVFLLIYERYRDHARGNRRVLELQKEVYRTISSEDKYQSLSAAEYLLCDLVKAAEIAYRIHNRRAFRIYQALKMLAKRFADADVSVERRFLRRTGKGPGSDRKGIVTSRNPLVSVIVPTYNRPALLQKALESVLAQTYPHFEVVVVNDAGSDAGGVIDGFHDARLRSLTLDENKGMAAARNAALAQARGELIAYLDDDDIYYPGHLETLVKVLLKNGEHVCFSRAYRAVQKAVDEQRYVTLFTYSPFRSYYDRDLLLANNCIHLDALMHRRECLRECGGFDETLRYGEDWEFLIRLSGEYRFRAVDAHTCEIRSRLDQPGAGAVDVAVRKKAVSAILEKHRARWDGRRHIIEMQRRIHQAQDAGAGAAASGTAEILLLELASAADFTYRLHNMKWFRVYQSMRRFMQGMVKKPQKG